LAIWRFGDLAICQFGDLSIWRFGDLSIWRFDDLKMDIAVANVVIKNIKIGGKEEGKQF